jgi:hypothetical protein
MAEIGIAEYFGIGEALGIIGTMFIVLYFSRKQMQALSVDIETKVLNDLDEKIHRMAEMLVEKPRLVKLLDRGQADKPDELVFAYYVSYMCSHAFHMRRRNVLSDNEWAGWMRWMKSAFERGTVREYWETQMEPGNWFDPAFEDFIDKEIIPKSKMVAGQSK